MLTAHPYPDLTWTLDLNCTQPPNKVSVHLYYCRAPMALVVANTPVGSHINSSIITKIRE